MSLEYDKLFLNSDREHILTSNLQIIKNNKLRKIISKGPKYREPEKLTLARPGMLLKKVLKLLSKHFQMLSAYLQSCLIIGNFHS